MAATLEDWLSVRTEENLDEMLNDYAKALGGDVPCASSLSDDGQGFVFKRLAEMQARLDAIELMALSRKAVMDG